MNGLVSLQCPPFFNRLFACEQYYLIFRSFLLVVSELDNCRWREKLKFDQRCWAWCRRAGRVCCQGVVDLYGYEGREDRRYRGQLGMRLSAFLPFFGILIIVFLVGGGGGRARGRNHGTSRVVGRQCCRAI
jgi:hypothetical protein